MKNPRQFTTIIAASLIAFLSIYAAVVDTFNTTNNTTRPVSITLQLQSGAQVNVAVPAQSTVPTTIAGDPVMGLTLYGVYAPVGANITIPNPSGGNATLRWQIGGDGSCAGGAIDTDEAS